MAHGKRGAPKGSNLGHPKRGGRRKGTPNKVASLAAVKLALTDLTAEVTVEAIRRGALYDVGALFDRAGDLRPLHRLTEAERFMIAGFEVVMKNAAAGDGKIDRVLKVKLAPRDRYVEMAAKYHALLTEKVEHDVTDELLARLDRGRLRNAKASG
jgi:hypothetical protein